MCMKKVVERDYGNIPHLSFVECDNKKEFYNHLLVMCREPFVMIANENCHYDKDALLWMYKLMHKTNLDVLETVVFLTHKGNPEYSFIRKILRRIEGKGKRLLLKGRNRNIENKLIRLKFLEQLYNNSGAENNHVSKEMWKKAQISMTDKWLITKERTNISCQKILEFLNGTM